MKLDSILKTIHFFLLFVILLWTHVTLAQVYVSADGSDEWIGTKDKPFKSLNKAIESLHVSKKQNSSKNETKIIIKIIQNFKGKGLKWDLHGKNAMQRSDGTIVITDPYSNNKLEKPFFDYHGNISISGPDLNKITRSLA